MEAREVYKMSLLDEAMESCILLNKSTVADGYGGYVTTYTDGAEFQAAIVFNSSIQALQAQKMGVTSVYRVTVRRAMSLEYHDVFRRERDGKIFRVTSDGDDEYTPKSATLDMRQVTCEEYALPLS